MLTRRQSIKYIITFISGVTAFFSKLGTGISLVYAKVKTIVLPRGTPMADLISQDPAELDNRNLETTPMDQFDVMGQTFYKVDLEKWRFEVKGSVQHPKKIAYKDLARLDPIERNVLLICPGFFAYNARWKGFSLSSLLRSAGIGPDVTHVEIKGSEGIKSKTEKFIIDDVMNDKLFIAFQVNGQALPERHGFPARLVAEGYDGDYWVKYVNRIEVFTDS